MSYTTPKTWAVNELVTASLMNQQVRDNLLYLKSPPVQSTANYASGPWVSSTSFVTVQGISMSLSTSTRVLIMAQGAIYGNTSLIVSLDFTLNGVFVGGADGRTRVYVPGGNHSGYCMVYLTDVYPAGALNIDVIAKVSTGSAGFSQMWLAGREI